jgi:hypothetical protein
MNWKAQMSSRRLLSAAALVALALALSACGSSGSSSSSAPQAQEGAGGGFGNRGPGGPGGSGKVAAVSGRTAQVQSTAGQVAVSWTAQTRFTQQMAAKASDLRVGDCVVAMPTAPATNASPGASTTTVAAATVRITAKSGGSCTGGFGRGGFGGGTPPTGGPSRQAGEAPSGAPSGGPNRRGGFGGFGAFGQVASVDGSTFTVKQVRPGSTSSSSVTVTTTGTTTWTTLASAAAKDVKVGRCVVSQGPTNSTGAVTAASIVISQPVNGQCTSGFGGGRFRPGGQGQNS